MIYIKLETSECIFESKNYPDDKEGSLIEMIKEFLMNGTHFQMRLKDDTPFFIGRKLMENAMISIEKRESE